MVEELTELIQESRALLFGPIRQQLLSGISDVRQFNTLRNGLRAFNDLSIREFDDERAAKFSNSFRLKTVERHNLKPRGE